jgi:hypothetical protein
VSGFLAALWLLGLFAAAPVLRASERYEFVDRLRDALILGIAIPFALGFIHALYPGACWCALALCIVLGRVRGLTGKAARDSRAPVPYLLVGALVAVTWPQLMRPLLDGDSLSYHLPNAASWVQAHSLWTNVTRYWWYPPASELFAAALYAVAGPFAITWSGFGALALLGFRIAAWMRSLYAAPPLLADALAAATITIYPLAIQGATLQNDVWLAAFFLESLWVLRTRAGGATAMRTLAVTALLKPQGWLFALIALIAQKARRTVWLAAILAAAVWTLRDVLLWQTAVVIPASSMQGNLLGSTILAHGVSALGLLVRVAAATSPFALLALLVALLAPVLAGREPRLRWAACLSVLLFLLLPFGYATSTAQLATGASLRFAAPAIAVGAVLIGRPARRIPAIATPLLIASTLYGIWYVLAIFWNDGGTHVAVAFAILAVAIAALARSQRIAWLDATAFGLGVIVATHLAARHPLDYYDDALRVGPTSPGIYRWIATTHPASIGAWGLRLGVVNVLSPSTRTVDLSDTGACAQARRDEVLLVAVAQNDLPFDVNSYRLSSARACGPLVYADALAVAVKPR